MKTRAEVLQYLKDKGLYDNVKRKLIYPIEKFPRLDTELHEFFTSAFNWKYSPEGEEYWRKVNREFLSWYGKIEPDEDDLKRRKRR